MTALRTEWANHVWNEIVTKVGRTSKRIGDSFPYASVNGQYQTEPADWWTNGFWPGLLWLIYRETRNESLRSIAESCERKLDQPLYEYTPLHHDVGFMWSPSAVANYKITGNERSKVRGLTAASHLMGRFNAAGSFIRAWNGEHQAGWAIIDCMMNLPLLYWASETTGDPRFRHIAVKHADTTLREFIRVDGSVHHIVCFDPNTGERIETLGGQGYAPDSAWARGCSWAIYGMTLSARYTGEERYLNAAKHVAQFFLSHLPHDRVPPYDFRAPIEEQMALDTTASACAASGLLELSQLVSANESEHYSHTAFRILESLYYHYSAIEQEDEEALIVKGTANYPQKHYVNTPIIYGDYYFVEALLKLKGTVATFW